MPELDVLGVEVSGQRVRGRACRGRTPGWLGRGLGSWVVSSAVALLGGCAPRTPAVSAAAQHPVQERAATNRVCASLLGRFVGLPAASGAGLLSAGEAPLPSAAAAPSPATPSASAEPTPLAGQWWIRGCSMQLGRGELLLRLTGPGWYWVDVEQGNFGLRQQVPLSVDAQLAGTPRIGYRGGVVSLWFEPTREPVVAVRASKDLDVRSASAWGSLLRLVPFVSIRGRFAEGLSRRASAAFRSQLAQGATVTYDIGRDQSDVALEQLDPGDTPERAFQDGTPWIVNDRLLLPPGTTHAFGPIEPGTEYQLDVVTERGPGLEYRALCVRDMPAYFERVMSGEPHRIEPRALVASGSLSGGGPHAAELSVPSCPFYIVVSAARRAQGTTLADVRLRT